MVRRFWLDVSQYRAPEPVLWSIALSLLTPRWFVPCLPDVKDL